MLSKEEIKTIWESKKWEGKHYIDYIGFAEAIMEHDKPCELTEDEIIEVADSVCHTWKKNGVGELYMTDFAKAILKKAGEK